MASIPRTDLGASHEGFLRHRNFLWLKLSLLLSLLALAGYALIDVQPRPNGGSAYGYALGTLGVLLILWLTLLGLRKRAMTRGRWSLKAWTSAHVYLGLSLIVVATLHTGFQFGWNVHTLAYALMMLVIFSGLYGIVAYARLPQQLGASRSDMTRPQMIDAVVKLDRQLAITARALAETRRRLAVATGDQARALESVAALLERKAAALARIRAHLRIKALLEIWLYVHVPVTFALLAALAAHIVSVFFYW
jgi:hypothetical protein